MPKPRKALEKMECAHKVRNGLTASTMSWTRRWCMFNKIQGNILCDTRLYVQYTYFRTYEARKVLRTHLENVCTAEYIFSPTIFSLNTTVHNKFTCLSIRPVAAKQKSTWHLRTLAQILMINMLSLPQRINNRRTNKYNIGYTMHNMKQPCYRYWRHSANTLMNKS
jgi:hypothetical protein